MSFHKEAHGASEAARCAHEQGKFWDYHDKLFANRTQLAPENLKQYAVDLGLNAEQFNACFDKGKYKNAVDEDFRAGSGYGVSGTPAFFINGRFVSGAVPYETLKQVIDEELELKGVAKPKG